ncbi:MAG: SPOR domain-containing protein [Candidatus Azobacteroides sp.]|nr:SPOR domain-containing protein [Candidatus Azobacteroides sp.]
MRRKIFLLTFSLFALGSVSIQAQKTIIESLESHSSDAEGVVHIETDSAIAALIGKPSAQFSNASGTTEQIERTGFRIQAFMGGDPGTARSEASSRRSLIERSFPRTPTYLSYEAPNWKLLVGDFLSREEATMFKQQLQKKFPQFSKELSITAEKIKFSVEKANE